MTWLYNSHCEYWVSNHKRRVLLFYRVFANTVVLTCFACISIFYVSIETASNVFNLKVHLESYIYIIGSSYIVNIILVAILSRLFYISSQLRLANMIDLIANIVLISSLFYFYKIMDLKLFMIVSLMYSFVLSNLTLYFLLKYNFLTLDNWSQKLVNIVVVFCCNALLLTVIDLNIMLGFCLMLIAFVAIFKYYPVTRWVKHIILQLNAAK